MVDTFIVEVLMCDIISTSWLKLGKDFSPKEAFLHLSGKISPQKGKIGLSQLWQAPGPSFPPPLST